MTEANVSHVGFLLAWVDAGTAGKCCAAGARRKGFLLHLLYQSRSELLLMNIFCFSTLMASEVHWRQCIFNSRGLGVWQWGRMWLHVRGTQEERQLNGSARRWGGKLSGFLKRTVTLFSESLECWNDNACSLLGCPGAEGLWVNHLKLRWDLKFLFKHM